MAWFGDALRQQHGSTHLDLPKYAGITAELAARHNTGELMQKASAIDRLRSNLNTNVHEALALENGFIPRLCVSRGRIRRVTPFRVGSVLTVEVTFGTFPAS